MSNETGPRSVDQYFAGLPGLPKPRWSPEERILILSRCFSLRSLFLGSYFLFFNLLGYGFPATVLYCVYPGNTDSTGNGITIFNSIGPYPHPCCLLALGTPRIFHPWNLRVSHWSGAVSLAAAEGHGSKQSRPDYWARLSAGICGPVEMNRRCAALSGRLLI